MLRLILGTKYTSDNLCELTSNYLALVPWISNYVYTLVGNKTMFRVALAILSLIESDLLQAHELGTLLPQILHPSPARYGNLHTTSQVG